MKTKIQHRFIWTNFEIVTDWSEDIKITVLTLYAYIMGLDWFDTLWATLCQSYDFAEKLLRHNEFDFVNFFSPKRHQRSSWKH